MKKYLSLLYYKTENMVSTPKMHYILAIFFMFDFLRMVNVVSTINLFQWKYTIWITFIFGGLYIIFEWYFMKKKKIWKPYVEEYESLPDKKQHQIDMRLLWGSVLFVALSFVLLFISK